MVTPKQPTSHPDDVKLANLSPQAPLIFFDQASTFGVRNHVAHITLEAYVYASVDGKVQTQRIPVAELRMSSQGLEALKAALTGIELLASKSASDAQN